MKAIPRVIAGTAVVLAAVLTAAPIGAGLADLVFSPDQHGKRLTAGAAQKTAAEAGEPWSGGTPEGTSPPVGVDGSDVVPLSPRASIRRHRSAATSRSARRGLRSGIARSADHRPRRRPPDRGRCRRDHPGRRRPRARGHVLLHPR
ncbi:hypothetical protein IOD13_10625 [Brevibacterium casei]|nr:hypothetical protein [Brevibacterium casei]